MRTFNQFVHNNIVSEPGEGHWRDKCISDFVWIILSCSRYLPTFMEQHQLDPSNDLRKKTQHKTRWNSAAKPSWTLRLGNEGSELPLDDREHLHLRFYLGRQQQRGPLKALNMTVSPCLPPITSSMGLSQQAEGNWARDRWSADSQVLHAQFNKDWALYLGREEGEDALSLIWKMHCDAKIGL